MKKAVQRLKNYIMRLSMQERKKREYACFEKDIQKLKSMSALELEAEYIIVKTKYEHHRNVLSLFLISIVLAVLMNAWKYFFDFIDQLLQLAFADQTDLAGLADIGFFISMILIAAITVAVFLMLIACVRKSSRLYRSLLMIEEVKSENEKHKEKDKQNTP